MGPIISRTIAVCQIDESLRREMYQLFEQYYSNTDFSRFSRDLFEKDHVFIFRERATGDLIGFSTIWRRCMSVAGRQASMIYSGDTVIRKDYWGRKFLQRRFFWYIVSSKFSAPWRPLYWMLISKGFKTYLMMRRNFPVSYPNYLGAAPAELSAVMNEFYAAKFGADYNHESGNIVFQQCLGAVRDEMAAPKARHLADPDVQYFLEKNPSYQDGVELACMAEIRVTDFIFHIFKFFVPFKVERPVADEKRMA
jgi:hypothetical protein